MTLHIVRLFYSTFGFSFLLFQEHDLGSLIEYFKVKVQKSSSHALKWFYE